jgi:sarcosine oxidase, subunit alpha
MTAPPTPLLAGSFTDPARSVTFTFEGRTIPAVEGQSIAAALYAAGVRVFSRSFKYHRPRGLFCVSGDCPNCLMQVDGRPNVRTCTERARQGQVVRGQNAWPSLTFDLLRVLDHLSYFLPVGFYYKRFHKPRWLWPVFERVVRRLAGLGRVDVRAAPDLDAGVDHRHAEVCVIGGGPAGLAAARSAAGSGAGVLLFERRPEPGGHLLDEGKPVEEVYALLGAGGDVPDRIEVLSNTTVFGLYEGNLLGAFQGDRLLKVRAEQVIVCTGGREQPFLFENNDLPGIFPGQAVLRLAHLYGVRAGKRAVVLTDNDGGHSLAGRLAALGVDVLAVVDRRPGGGKGPGDVPVLPAHTVLRARGRTLLRGVDVARVDAAGVVEKGSAQRIACDLLCLAPRLVPANELLRQGGMRFVYQGGCWRPEGAVPGLLAAGAAAGTLGLEAQVEEGRRRGAEAAARVRGDVPVPVPLPVPDSGSGHGHGQGTGKCFVCLCEDVTVKDLGQAVAEGFDHIETLKRYATVGMGPCQGKMCGHAFTEVCANLTGRDLHAVGTTTSRPPAVPVELAVLAGERRHHPVRRTPLHAWHESAGARWLDAGQWKRPESYGDPEGEVRAVRSGVGLIDVSTLGKVEVIGPDAAELLERVYVNGWADLGAGRARYGVMCTEEGIVFDDGVGARLGPDHFYLTATTGNAEGVFQWLELWRTTWRLNVTVLNQTSALAAVNLAGPRARAVLGQLIGSAGGSPSLDLSPAAFPYPGVREGEVAGVRCRLLRVGFVGELGYEIHCPSCHAWHLWEALLDAGKGFGLRPFGVEAQRVLRLEKGHFIVGQDTDALSDPLGAGLERMVRFGKPFFHGREPLLRLKELGPRSRLVGFHLPGGAPGNGPAAPAPEWEGCQVVEGGRPAGRVTSARFSPTLGKTVGLAWVPAARSAVGERFFVRFMGRDVPAVVASLPFYDPKGERLKG